MQTTSRGYKKPEMTDGLEESLPMLQNTIDAIDADVAALAEEQASQAQDIAALETNVGNLGTAQSSQAQSIATLETNVGDVHDDLAAHTVDTSNPHNTTAVQVLPEQTGKAGRVLGTNGEVVEWIEPVDIDEIKRVLSMGGMI